jgi:hypothetical protein
MSCPAKPSLICSACTKQSTLKRKRRKNIHQIAEKVHFHWLLLSPILGRISEILARRQSIQEVPALNK